MISGRKSNLKSRDNFPKQSLLLFLHPTQTASTMMLLASARSVYANILETDNNVYVPQYGFGEDKEILDLVSELYDKNIIGVDVEKVSVMGGAVNCLT